MPIDLSPEEQSLVEATWKGLQGGDFPQEVVEGSLELETAYRVQLGILERQLAAGRRLAGWKAGNPPPPVRAALGDQVMLSGPLLADGLRESGSEVPADTPGLLLEVEVGLSLGSDLEGPDATAAQARAAVASIDPCFELVGGRLPKLSLERIKGFVAVGMGNFGVVQGSGLSPVPEAFDPGGLSTELWIDGSRTEAPAMDGSAGSPLQVLADLANHLARFGQRIEAGQRVITGARVVRMDCAPGQYEGRIAGLGNVNVTLR